MSAKHKTSGEGDVRDLPGRSPDPIDPDVIRQYGERARQMRANPEYGVTYWKAALRQIEGKGIDWRQ